MLLYLRRKPFETRKKALIPRLFPVDLDAPYRIFKI